MAKSNYRSRIRRYTLIAFAAPVALAYVGARLMRGTEAGEHFWLVLLGGLVLVTVTVTACIPWWRSMDDMQKQGHMIGWYWGGTSAGLAMLAWLVAALGMKSGQAQGALAVLVAQTLGFALFFAVWSWRKRGTGE